MAIPAPPPIDATAPNALYLQWIGDCIVHVDHCVDDLKKIIAALSSRLDLYDEEALSHLAAKKEGERIAAAEAAVRARRFSTLRNAWEVTKELSRSSLILAGGGAVAGMLWRLFVS